DVSGLPDRPGDSLGRFGRDAAAAVEIARDGPGRDPGPPGHVRDRGAPRRRLRAVCGHATSFLLDDVPATGRGSAVQYRRPPGSGPSHPLTAPTVRSDCQ